MRTICIQVQPERARGLDVKAVARLMLRIAIAAKVQEFSVIRGANDHWLNFLFTVKGLRPMWRKLRSGVLSHAKHGAKLRRCTIVSAQGSRGWANYRLLHHFNGAEPLDEI